MVAYKVWADQNPLAVWRREHGNLPRSIIAVKVGVSYNMVGRWELGQATPSAGNMEVLADIMGVTPDNLQSEWESWLTEGQAIKI